MPPVIQARVRKILLIRKGSWPHAIHAASSCLPIRVHDNYASVTRRLHHRESVLTMGNNNGGPCTRAMSSSCGFSLLNFQSSTLCPFTLSRWLDFEVSPQISGTFPSVVSWKLRDSIHAENSCRHWSHTQSFRNPCENFTSDSARHLRRIGNFAIGQGRYCIGIEVHAAQGYKDLVLLWHLASRRHRRLWQDGRLHRSYSPQVMKCNVYLICTVPVRRARACPSERGTRRRL